MKFKRRAESAALFLKKYSSRIIYYACVAVVLTAIAVAAESYRKEAGQELVLPQAQLPVISQKEEKLPFVPEGMVLLRAYTAQPEWNRETQQWEAHTAADYGFESGAVPCLEDGVVRTIGKSGVYGGFVEVECGDAIYRYASIVPSERLCVGDALEAGEEIGAADCAMPGEQNLGDHLHLEIECSGSFEDYELIRANHGAIH